MKGAKRVAICGMLVALAFIFSYIEMLIPISFGIPGIKLGLANLIILSSLYFLSPANVLIILVTRIFLSGFLFSNMAAIIYSLAGGLLSFLIMLIFKKLDKFSSIGVSILGGISHNIGQILVAVMVVDNLKIAFYLPILLISGAVTGTVIGVVSKRVMKIRLWKYI